MTAPECPDCGAAVSVGARFCRNCGIRLTRRAFQPTNGRKRRLRLRRPRPVAILWILAMFVGSVLFARHTLAPTIHHPALLKPTDNRRKHGPFRIGDEVGLGPYSISVFKVTDPFRLPPPPPPPRTSPGYLPPVRVGVVHPPGPGERLVRVDVEVANLGKTRVNTFAAFALRGQDGLKPAYPENDVGPPKPPAIDLPPHGRSSGTLIFKLPRATKLDSFNFDPYYHATDLGDVSVTLKASYLNNP